LIDVSAVAGTSVRELVPSFVRAGDDLGVAQLSWPNIAAALEFDAGHSVDVVPSPGGSTVDALVEAAVLRV
jgi:hypothetical protein